MSNQEISREELDAWLEKNCGKGIPYQNATDTPSMLHGLAYILRQIESTNKYMVNIGQTGPATSSLRMALDHFAGASLSPVVKPLEWQDISTAPKDGTPFQAWCEGYGWQHGARFNPNTEAFELWGRVDYDQEGWDVYPHMTPTHWMPEPEKPS